MIDSLTSENHRDFHARYGNTFGFLHRDTGSKLLVYVSNADKNKVRFKDINGLEYHAIVDKNVKFEFLPVDRGYFNCEYKCYQLSRVPARQWHRGICYQNTRILTESLTGEMNSLNNRGDDFFQALQDIFTKQTIPYEKAFADWNNYLRPGVAISKYFYLSNKRILNFLGTEVGKYEMDTINIHNPLIYQEVLDAVRRNNLPIRVIYD